MSDTELEIVSVLEDARIAAMVQQDAETLRRLLSDDLHYVHSSGNVDTKATFIDNVQNGPVQYRSIERRNEAGRLAGDGTALFTGEASIRVEVGGDPLDLEVRYLAVWARHDGTWRFEAWQTALI